MHYNRFTLAQNESGVPNIIPCYCRDKKYKDGVELKCSEIPCGYSFDTAKEKLIDALEQRKDKLKEIKTYEQYVSQVR